MEEATALELPMLSKNLVILSTCASISTLLGLIGTVLGMIRAFSAWPRPVRRMPPHFPPVSPRR
jgi:biopolymer transport protein ExbB/TolQ